MRLNSNILFNTLVILVFFVSNRFDQPQVNYASPNARNVEPKQSNLKKSKERRRIPL